MIGARALAQTLVDSGVDVCFMNPGTSEMHFVNELDAVPQMRGVLALFEGVATGAADGYARMTGRLGERGWTRREAHAGPVRPFDQPHGDRPGFRRRCHASLHR